MKYLTANRVKRLRCQNQSSEVTGLTQPINHWLQCKKSPFILRIRFTTRMVCSLAVHMIRCDLTNILTSSFPLPSSLNWLALLANSLYPIIHLFAPIRSLVSNLLTFREDSTYFIQSHSRWLTNTRNQSTPLVHNFQDYKCIL